MEDKNQKVFLKDLPIEKVEDSFDKQTSENPVNQPIGAIGSYPQEQSSMQPTQNVGKALPKFGIRFSRKMLVFGLIFLLVLGIFMFLAIKFRPSNISKFFGKRGEIVWWGLNEESEVVKPLIEEFQKSHPNVKITYVKQSTQDYRVRLSNSLASGKGPDIFEFHNTWVPMFRNDLSTLPQEVMSQSEFSQTFYPVIVSDLLISNGLVGIPLFYDGITLFINQDLFASTASTPPTTWNDLLELVHPTKGKFTIRNDQGFIVRTGIALGTTTNVDFWQDILALIIFQNGSDLKTIVSNKVVDAISFYRLFSREDNRVWDNTLPPSTVAFAQGKIAMYFAPTRKAYEIAKSNPNLKFKTVRLPQLPKNSPTDPDFSYANYWVQGVWQQSANKDIAWKFLKFLSEKESITKLNQSRRLIRGFELMSPRSDMFQEYLEDPILGSLASLIYSAKSWYLAGETFDGEAGINTKISGVFKNLLSSGGGSQEELSKLDNELINILAQYGLRKAPAPTIRK